MNLFHKLLASTKSKYWGYGFGASLCLLGLVAVAVAFGQVLRTTAGGFHQISLPGDHMLSLNPGYHIAVTKGDTLPAAGASNIMVFLTDPQTGNILNVEMAPPGMRTGGGHSGQVLFRFQINNPGVYNLSLSDSTAKEGTSVGVYLFHESLGSNRADIVVGIILCLLFCGIGLYIIVRTYKQFNKKTNTEPTKTKK